MMDMFGAKKRMYDEMEKYAGDKGAEMSGPLREHRGVPIMQESVTVVAKPKPGEKLTPEQLREKVGKMGILPGLEKGMSELLPSEDDLAEFQRQLDEDARKKKERGG